MKFDQNGFLTPYAPILTDLATVERVFVTEFPDSTTRRAHFNRYLDYNARLSTYLPDRNAGAGFTQWVDGSFISRKQNPNDIDVLTFIDHALYAQHETALRELRQEFLTGGEGKVDARTLTIYPEGHRYRVYFESDQLQWLFDWSRTARPPRRQKGFVELQPN